MHGAYLRRRAAAASAKGKKGAAVRWKRDRERRDALALLDPVRVGGRIVLRVVVIRNELRQREAIVYEHDTERDTRRKIKAAMTP